MTAKSVLMRPQGQRPERVSPLAPHPLATPLSKYYLQTIGLFRNHIYLAILNSEQDYCIA